MAHITKNSDNIKALCANCGQEVKIDKSHWLSDGLFSWHEYHCEHCGYYGSIDHNIVLDAIEIEPEHRAYSLDEILEMNDKTMPDKEDFIKKEKPSDLTRIADALEDIRDILKRLDKVKL